MNHSAHRLAEILVFLDKCIAERVSENLNHGANQRHLPFVDDFLACVQAEMLPPLANIGEEIAGILYLRQKYLSAEAFSEATLGKDRLLT